MGDILHSLSKFLKKEQRSESIDEFSPPGLVTSMVPDSLDDFKDTLGMRCRAKTLTQLIGFVDSLPEHKWQINIMAKKGGKVRKVQFFDDFPILEDANMLNEDYGGGRYVVMLSSPRRAKFGHYVFDGEESTPEKEDTGDEPREQKLNIKFKPKNLGEAVLLQKLQQGDPQFTKAYIQSELKKLGVEEEKGEKKKTLDELVAEEIEKSPDYREKLVKAEIEKRTGKEKPVKEKDTLEQLTELAETWEKMRLLFGEKQKGTDWGDVIKEFLRQGGIGELAGTIGAVMKEGEPQQRAPKQLTEGNSTAQIVSPPPPGANIQEMIQYLPVISKFVEAFSPQDAVNMLNGVKPEYCDILYEISYDMLQTLLEKMKDLPELQGKIDILYTEKGQEWVKEFLNINKQMIDKEIAQQEATDA